MGGMQGGNNSFLLDPNQQQQQQPQLSPYGQQGMQAPPQQQQQQPQQLQPSIFTQQSPTMQQQQGGMMYNNQNSQQSRQQQQAVMQSTPHYQQQQQQASPYNFSPPPQPANAGFAQRSAMMQQQSGGGTYGNVPNQQQQPAPPVSQIHVPNRQQQQQSNTYGGGSVPSAPAPGSYAQRYQAMQQQPNQQQAAPQTSNNTSIYSQVAGGSDNLYPPSPQRQQQQHQQQQQSGSMMQQQDQPPAAPGSFAQRQASMMGQQNQQQAPAPGSFAQRQAAMTGQNPSPQGGGMMQQQQQQFQQPGQPQMQQQQQQFQQPGLQQQQQFQQPGLPQMQQQQPQQLVPPQVPQRLMLVDPPEVIAQQQRLLTDATRKVQEHAYYMKQAIDRHDLPVVLERAACMVGELGEHAHSHKSHKLHPPPPGATGTSTALQPKNYYELHLRALEELPTLENYLLDVANTSKQQGQLQQPQQQVQQPSQQPPQQVQQQQPGIVGAPAPVPSSANSSALMQQLTGDLNASGGDNFLNPPSQQPTNMNTGNPLEGGPGAYSNVMGGNIGAMNNNPMMANSQMNMGMGMTNSGMMMGQQQPQFQQHQQFQQQPMMNNSDVVPPSPPITYTMMELYDCVQYCPNVLSRLYLQICAASALIRSGEAGARWVFKDLIEAVKCVQNPVRGLFLRHYLLQAFRDKLPDVGIPVDQIGSIIRGTSASAAPTRENSVPVENVSTPAPKMSDSIATTLEPGTVKDSYEFVLANFIEMNKLWVRIQHLPGDLRTKAVRRRREKDRNELRILVGTNLVRLSALDSVTSTIYGQVILPTVLDQIVICADPLSQAYLLDCIVQVFPDEYHIETMPILLAVCPKLRDKVNIRTILHSLMTRLANYLADEELLDEKDSNQVKRAVALDSFRMFNECVQNVYNARGPKLNAKEVIRLQTALLEYSMKCYKGNLEQITLCLQNCVAALQQARDNAAYLMPPPPQQNQYGQPQMPPPPPPSALEPVATKELEKLLSIPLEELALGVLTLDHYSDLIAFLPWNNRRELALNILESVINTGKPPESVKEIEELFSVIAPVLRGEHDEGPSSSAEVDRTTNLMAGLGVSPEQQQQQQQMYAPQPQQGFNAGGVNPIHFQQDSAMVSKFIGMLDYDDTDLLFEMLTIARKHMNTGQSAVQRASSAHAALIYASLKLARRVYREAHEEPSPAENASGEEEKIGSVSSAEEPKTSTEKDDEEEATEETKVETAEEEADGETKEATAEEEVDGETKEETTEEEVNGETKEEKIEEDAKPAAQEEPKAEETPKAPKSIT